MVSAGDRLGGHLLVEPVGDKGEGRVWLARSPAGEQVMLEVTELSPDQEDSTRVRLERDLATVQGLAHHNVLRVLGAGVEMGFRFVTTEYTPGVFLADLLAEGRELDIGMSPGVAGYILLQLARALDAVQGAADPRGQALGPRAWIEPSSVFVAESGVVKLGDLVPNDAHVAGAYASPETFSGTIVDRRADLFSVGVILWEMLAGRKLFARASNAETITAVQNDEVPALPAYVPARLSAVTMRCLARDPSERYSSPAVLEAALEAATADQPDASTAGVSAHVADLRAAKPSRGRPRTFALSEASQTGRPRRSDEDKTTPSEPPSAARLAHTPSQPPAPRDEFFDVERDGGGISNPRFEVLGRLGSGGMGEVYRVRDHELNEIVALKLIPSHTASELQSLERLKREVRLARRIASDHVCRIFDLVDLGHGARGLTMALINGTTLAEMMKTGLQVDYQRFAKWGAHIAHGLAAAHAVNIIHRDLKPENVMVDNEDRAVILDFGIARSQADALDVDGKLTQAGIIMGTPLYMSPEQLINRELDGRSDLYALGLLLGELITGEVPLYGQAYADIVDRRVVKASTNRYRITDFDPGVPKDLASVIDRLVAAAADDRPEDATTASALLMACANPDPAAVVRDTNPPVAVAEPTDASPVPSEAVVANDVATTNRPESKWYGMIAVLTVLALVLGVWVMRAPPSDGAKVIVAPPPPPPPTTVVVDSPDAGTRDAGVPRSKPPPPPVVEEM